MSIDVWMGFAEKTTKYLDFSIASWWPSQEMMPSNYQMLIAQYCHELVILAPNLKAALSNFAREYHKEYGKTFRSMFESSCMTLIEKLLYVPMVVKVLIQKRSYTWSCLTPTTTMS